MKKLVVLTSGFGLILAAGVVLIRNIDEVSDGELASTFFRDNRQDLFRLISIAKRSYLPRRIEIEGTLPPGKCTNDPECKSAHLRSREILQSLKIPVMIVNEQCHRSRNCSISFVLRRKGLGISGSGTELIYDEHPRWGSFVIETVEGAPPHWFYRHLGD